MQFSKERLIYLMQTRFYNGAELAEAIGTSRQTVYRWLRGEAKPSTKNMKAICEALNLEPTDLLIEIEEE